MAKCYYEWADSLTPDTPGDGKDFYVYMADVSANAFDKDVKISIVSGMNAHLAKPVEISKMKKLMRQILKNGKENRENE